jgi:hypothetical protein
MTKRKGSKIHKQQQIQSVRQAVHIHLDTRKKQRRKKKARAFRPVAMPPPVMRVVSNHIVLPENAGIPPANFFQQQALKQKIAERSQLLQQEKTKLAVEESKDLQEHNQVKKEEMKVREDAVAELSAILDKTPRTPEQLAKAKSLYPNRRNFPKSAENIQVLIANAPPPRFQQPTISSSSRTQADEFKEPSFMERVITKQF